MMSKWKKVTNTRPFFLDHKRMMILSKSKVRSIRAHLFRSMICLVSPACTCQCHQSALNPNPTNEYLLFEQALRQTRQEQQQEGSLNNNQLIQTLKRQHQELVTLYHRQIHINKTDREQQTMQINQHDSQIQTDFSTLQQQNAKSIVQINGMHSTPNLRGATSTAPARPFNSFLTPIRTTGPSLQQLIPCLTTTTAMIKKTTTALQDFVDLTEDDDDHAASVQKISPVKQVSIGLLLCLNDKLFFRSNKALWQLVLVSFYDSNP